MLLMSASWVSGLSLSQRAIGPGMRRTVPVACSSSRTMRRPAPAIWGRRRLTVTFSSRSSCLRSPRRAALMNEFSSAGSRSVQAACRASCWKAAGWAGETAREVSLPHEIVRALLACAERHIDRLLVAGSDPLLLPGDSDIHAR